eukprot:3771644-Rhodomonas_salina.1
MPTKLLTNLSLSCVDRTSEQKLDSTRGVRPDLDCSGACSTRRRSAAFCPLQQLPLTNASQVMTFGYNQSHHLIRERDDMRTNGSCLRCNETIVHKSRQTHTFDRSHIEHVSRETCNPILAWMSGDDLDLAEPCCSTQQQRDQRGVRDSLLDV